MASEEVGTFTLTAAWTGTGASAAFLGAEAWCKSYFADEKEYVLYTLTVPRTHSLIMHIIQDERDSG